MSMSAGQLTERVCGCQQDVPGHGPCQAGKTIYCSSMSGCCVWDTTAACKGQARRGRPNCSPRHAPLFHHASPLHLHYFNDSIIYSERFIYFFYSHVREFSAGNRLYLVFPAV